MNKQVMNSGKLTISRPMSSNTEEKLSITLQDKDARIQFLEIEIGLADMMQALTGLGNTPCEFTVRGLENVGKVCVTETFEFPFENKGSWNTSKEEAFEEAKRVCPEGWTPSSYFGSKGSFFEKDGVRYARTSISKWEDK